MWFKRGDDGLTDRQRKTFAARWRKVADMPVSDDVRERARNPSREVLHLKREGLTGHIVELSKGDKARLIEWLQTGTGAWIPQSSSRLTIESVEHGGIFIRTYPWTAE